MNRQVVFGDGFLQREENLVNFDFFRLKTSQALNIVNFKHQRSRLLKAIFFAAHLKMNTGPRRQVAVARAVDHHLGQHRFAPGFTFDERAGYAIRFYHGVGDVRVVPGLVPDYMWLHLDPQASKVPLFMKFTNSGWAAKR
jgi:hypothetical protein